jgi:hypothetical protein
MKVLLPFLLFLLAPVGAYAQSAQVDSVNVLEYGIYTSSDVGTKAAPGTATGQEIDATNLHLVTATRTVPARQGVEFGFQYTVVGPATGTNVSLHFVTIFPAPGLTNPATQQLMAQSEYDDTATIGTPTYKGYQLTNAWEVAPGQWTMQVWYNGRKLAEQTFILIKQ